MSTTTIKKTTNRGAAGIEYSRLVQSIVKNDRGVVLTPGNHYVEGKELHARIMISREMARQYGVKVTVTNKFVWTHSEKATAKREDATLPKWNNRQDKMRCFFVGVRDDATDAQLEALTERVGSITGLASVSPENRGVRVAA